MNKKTLTLICSTIAVFSVGAVSILGMTSGNSNTFAIDDNHNHTVVFTGSDVTPGAYDEEYYTQVFSLSKKDAIVVSETEKYDLASVDTTTYCYADEGVVTWGGDNIASIASYNYECFYIEFSLVKRATLDLNKSVADFYINGNYNNEKFYVADEGEEFISYAVNVAAYSDYGAKIDFKQVKLVFSC